MASIKSLFLVWIALLVLLALTVAGSFMTTGAISVTVSLGIALAKAGLVYWFFMNLRSENGLIRLAATGAVIWLLLLLLLAAADFATR